MCAPLTLNIQNQFLGPLVSGANCLQAVFLEGLYKRGGTKSNLIAVVNCALLQVISMVYL